MTPIVIKKNHKIKKMKKT